MDWLTLHEWTHPTHLHEWDPLIYLFSTKLLIGNSGRLYVSQQIFYINITWNSSLPFHKLILLSFPLVEALLELLFCYNAKLYYHIPFNILLVFKFLMYLLLAYFTFTFHASGDVMQISTHLECYREDKGCPRGIMVKAMDCGIVVSEFIFQLRYYVHFWANTLGKGMNPLNLPAMG